MEEPFNAFSDDEAVEGSYDAYVCSAHPVVRMHHRRRAQRFSRALQRNSEVQMSVILTQDYLILMLFEYLEDMDMVAPTRFLAQTDTCLEPERTDHRVTDTH